LKIEFIGTGPACDPGEPNTSFCLHKGNEHILFDCGFTVPHLYFARNHPPDSLKAVWISHFHADHFFGLPLLLLKLIEVGRREPLSIIGPRGLAANCGTLFDLAYGGLAEHASFAWEYLEMAPDEGRNIGDVRLSVASNDHHHRQALSVSVAWDGRRIFYSGDGIVGKDALEIAADADLLILESYRALGKESGYNNLTGCRKFFGQSGADKLALVHIEADERGILARELAKKKDRERIFLPRSGDLFSLPDR